MSDQYRGSSSREERAARRAWMRQAPDVRERALQDMQRTTGSPSDWEELLAERAAVTAATRGPKLEARRTSPLSLPPIPTRRRAPAPPAVEEPELLELSDDDLEEVDGHDSVPTREEIPDLSPSPYRSDLEPLRGSTSPGYPAPVFESAPPRREPSRRRSKLGEPVTVDHADTAADRHLYETTRSIDGLTQRIKAHVSHDVAPSKQPTPPASRSRGGYAPLQAPPSPSSWLASVAKRTISQVKAWFTNEETSSSKRTIEEPKLGETIRLLEQAERDIRDLPTQFLTGKPLSAKSELITRASLDASKRRWQDNAASLQARRPSAERIIEHRRRSITDTRGPALQRLLESDRRAVQTELDPEQEANILLLAAELSKHLRRIDALRVSLDPQKREAAERALQALKMVVGGTSLQELTTRILLTCEAAARLPFAEIGDPVSAHILRIDYAERLKRIQQAIGFQGDSRDILDDLRNSLAMEQASTSPRSRAAA